MIEAPFVSVSPMWTAPLAGAIQTPVQTPINFGNAALGAAALGSSPYPYFSGKPSVASGVNPAIVPMGSFPQPGFAISEPAAVLTAPALLAAVAMRRGQPQGPANDQEVEEFIYDALELLSGTGDIEVRCEGGRATLSGNVHHKRAKRDVGEIAWAIPAVNDVQNNIAIASRRRVRANRETETPGTPTRK